MDPAHQRMGIGAALLARAKAWAVEQGATETALDTASKAKEQINFYLACGYSEVDFTRWPGKTYESSIFAKELL